MPSFSTDVLRRYGCAILSVALAVVTRLALYPILGNRYPFFLFFIAVVLAAGYGGYGPSLLALVLSWLSVDYLFLSSVLTQVPSSPNHRSLSASLSSGWRSPCSADSGDQPVNVPSPAAWSCNKHSRSRRQSETGIRSA